MTLEELGRLPMNLVEIRKPKTRRKDRKTNRQKDRNTKIQKDRQTKRPKDRKTKTRVSIFSKKEFFL